MHALRSAYKCDMPVPSRSVQAFHHWASGRAGSMYGSCYTGRRCTHSKEGRYWSQYWRYCSVQDMYDSSSSKTFVVVWLSLE